jgi:hypothetical protein
MACSGAEFGEAGAFRCGAAAFPRRNSTLFGTQHRILDECHTMLDYDSNSRDVYTADYKISMGVNDNYVASTTWLHDACKT